MNKTETMIKALRVLSKDIQSGDGVANACVSDASDMIENMSTQLAKANERMKELEGNLLDSGVLINQLGGDRSLLKDYAIRQQMIILETLLGRTCPVSGLVIPDKRSREAIEDHLEQLRKEQE